MLKRGRPPKSACPASCALSDPTLTAIATMRHAVFDLAGFRFCCMQAIIWQDQIIFSARLTYDAC